ncbi:riboflavin biosynthesis protein [Bacteroidia bacterium]|nr:riboflavin biosynthesis protein [Bacteroidia bacterium]
MEGSIATIGFFDGVHCGHRYLLRQLKEQAEKSGLKAVVITFPIHPRKVLQQEYQPKLLTSPDERKKLLLSLEIDRIDVLDFTREMAELTAQEFMRKSLRDQLNVKELLIGYDHKFGKGRTDNFEQYVEYGKACGITVYQAEALPEKEKQVSSTYIRNLLSEGKIREANENLCYRYGLQGKVIRGNQLGRTIGFPTANLELAEKDKMLPKDGVYSVLVETEDKNYCGMAYIGQRPTVLPEGGKRVEVNIFDFSDDIYGNDLRIELIDFIRPEIRFDNLEDLRRQLEKDKQKALA